MHPELAKEVVDLVRGLWPNAKWNSILRKQWIDQLYRYSSKEICEALKHHHAKESFGAPRLSSVVAYIKGNRLTSNQTNEGNMPTKEEIEKQTKSMLEVISQASRDDIENAKKIAQDIMPRRDWDTEIDKWTRMQIALIYQTLSTHGNS